MATSRRWWKQREQDAAALFGARRKPGSGSGGRPDETCSDSVHPRIFLECKVRETNTTRTLWEATKLLAKKEHKTPVLTLFDKGRQGCLVVVHQDDFRAVAAEYLAAADDDVVLTFERDVRVARIEEDAS
jgi:hypothetical protein